jgi:hypothetical protein
MAASREDISGWFDSGVADGATHMIVVCDTFDHDDYPIFCKGAAACLDQYKGHHNVNMQRVMEVYDLHADKTEQLNEPRAMRLPLAPANA